MSHKSASFAAVSTIGIDLGKNIFHLVGLDQRGAIVLQLKCSRAQLERRLANIASCLIGMEACSGAHYIARQLAALGHDVRLLPAQYVKPFLKGLPDILSSNTQALSPRMVNLITELVQDWRRLDERVAAVSAEIEALAEQDEACQRVMTVPGVGPIISSAVVAAIGNGAGFTQGRDFGAWLGLVPKQESTGDRTILGKISKRGNKYLRTLFVQAAHVVLARRPRAAMRGLWPWIEQAFEAAPPQHVGNRARQQARPHRLGCSLARSRISAADRASCSVTRCGSADARVRRLE